MKFIFRALSNPYCPQHNQHRKTHLRTLVDSTIKWVRDRGLDHAVEKEKNLLPLINVKNFIKSEPSKSAPISIIAQNRDSLEIPLRPIDFIRKYPSVFEEFLPGGIGIQPHIRLTSEVLELDADEQLIYQSENCRQQAADQLLKLLMLSRIHKIPLRVIDRLKWDLGLPEDYVQSIVPEFPDYFQVVDTKVPQSGSREARMLELVCWKNDLATSAMERKMMKTESCYTKGMPAAFPLRYSKGFEMDKKLKKWVDEWQKLPYVSPYENASHLLPKSDEFDKWAVGVLHELLHILIAKKTDRENILHVGEYFGLRSRFKRALLYHPGIFYLSNKIGTYTVVLREGYRRGSLIENHPLMALRSQYIHLMNMVKEGNKPLTKPGLNTQQQKQMSNSEDNGERDVDDNGEEHEGELFDSSDAEVEGDSNSDGENVDERRNQVGVRRNVAGNNRIRTRRRRNADVLEHSRNSKRGRSVKKANRRPKEKVSVSVT